MSRYDAIPDALVTADLGEGLGVQPVIDWSVSRKMSGGGLPGQARGASGMSVGSGTVTLDSPAGRTPWTTGPVRPGGRVSLDARADASETFAPVARMVARDVSGAASSRSLSVSIEDDLTALRAPAAITIPPALVGLPMDAAGVVALLAAQAGYHAVPPPVVSAYAAVPLVGSHVPAVGIQDASLFDPHTRFIERDSQAGLARAIEVSGFVGTAFNVTPTQTPSGAAATFATFDYAYISPSEAPGGYTYSGLDVRPGGLRVTLNGNDTPAICVDAQGGMGDWVSVPGAPSWPAGWVRMQVQAEWIGLSGDTATGARVRARIGATGAWSAWSTYVGSIDTADPAYTSLKGYLGTRNGIRGYQAHTDDDPAVWASPSARIGVSGSLLTAVLPEPARSGWETMQEIARATLGWVGIDADGMLTCRGRDKLRGGAPAETIISEDSLEDVSWTISADDVADRVEVTYRPPTLLTTAPVYPYYPSHTVWESTETLTLGAGRVATVTAEIEGSVARIADMWLPVWNTALPAASYSRWNAFPNSDGTGTQPPDNALAIESTLLSSNRVHIRVRNTTAATLYVTQLTIRAYTAARAGEAVTLSRGLPADKARAPLAYDLGTWVQDDDTAREILDWLEGSVSNPMPTLSSVRVIPNPARRLGQIVKVTDRTTSLAAKALIAGISMSGSDGSLTQTLDLTILSTTFDDIDTWLTREGLTTFDLLDARLTALGLDTFDKLDDFLSRLGGTL